MQMRKTYVYVKVRHTICIHSNRPRLLCSVLLVGLPWLVNLYSFVPGMQLQVKAHFPHWPYEISAR